MRLIIVGWNVYFDNPETHVRLGLGLSGQVVLPFELRAVEQEMRITALRMRERQPDDIGKIIRRREVVSNAWVLAGTRVPTEAVWNFHSAGADLSTILAAYPSLTATDVEKAIEFELGRRQHRQAS
ncbi:MAG TPA: DUF433 domain-containing protein [Chloroflexota bacterium]